MPCSLAIFSFGLAAKRTTSFNGALPARTAPASTSGTPRREGHHTSKERSGRGRNAEICAYADEGLFPRHGPVGVFAGAFEVLIAPERIGWYGATPVSNGCWPTIPSATPDPLRPSWSERLRAYLQRYAVI